MEPCSPSRRPHACCNDERNLVALPRAQVDVEVLICKCCGANHTTLNADYGIYGAVFSMKAMSA